MPLISQRGRYRRRSHRRWNSGDSARQEVETAGFLYVRGSTRQRVVDRFGPLRTWNAWHRA